MKDVMIDIETLGLKPNSVILSIGAARFDRRNGVLFQQMLVRISPNQSDREIDEATLRWWLEQPGKTIADAFSGYAVLPEALRILSRFINADDIVWSQGTDFDFPILQDAFDLCEMPVPWKYFAKRDTRTIYDICRFDPKSIERSGTYHNALDDCRHQIKCVAAAIKNLGASTP